MEIPKVPDFELAKFRIPCETQEENAARRDALRAFLKQYYNDALFSERDRMRQHILEQGAMLEAAAATKVSDYTSVD